MKMKFVWKIVLCLGVIIFSQVGGMASEGSIDRFRDLPRPPADAPTGVAVDHTRIGLWAAKEKFQAGEIRNVWYFALKESHFGISIGVGGVLHRDSFIFITDSHGKELRISMGAPIDGMVNATAFYGGISDRLKDLPPGQYELVWKAGGLESNRIKIELE